MIRALIAVLLATPLLSPAATFDDAFHQLEQTQTFDNVTISPDGAWVTWTAHGAGDTRQTFVKQSGAEPREITAPEGAEIHAIAWSRDSKQLAFIAEVKNQRQIFVMHPDDQNAQQISHLEGYADDLHWSPDSASIAFLYAEKGNGGGPLVALPAQVGEIGEDLHNQRITTIALADGALHALTPAELNIYEFDWSADGSKFVAIAAPGPADNNWWIAKLYTVDAQSGASQVIYAPPPAQQIAIPRWSPDGAQITFIGGLMSDEGAVGGDVFVLPASGGRPRDITPAMPASAKQVYWTAPNDITGLLYQDGGTVWAHIDVRSGERRVIWKNVATIASQSLSADGKSAAMCLSEFQHPPAVWTGPLDALQQVTHVNDTLHPNWGKAENVTWTSGTFKAQGWLLYPSGFDPSKRYPMIVSVHGGPASMRGNGWPSTHFDMSVFAGIGYFVFFPNPRGSYGQGEAYTRGNIKDFGHGDLRDIESGIDEVLKRAPVDPARLGITGWSYGGYMTMWTVTQTQRFRAAVAGAGIANWLSYYGENSIDQWMVPYFGAPIYRARAVYARSSPIEYINAVKTPTLVLVGERDAECPAPQSFEFWHALKTLGVPTGLVVYEGEGHGFKKPANQLDRMRRTAAWFDKYLNASR